MSLHRGIFLDQAPDDVPCHLCGNAVECGCDCSKVAEVVVMPFSLSGKDVEVKDVLIDVITGHQANVMLAHDHLKGQVE